MAQSYLTQIGILKRKKRIFEPNLAILQKKESFEHALLFRQ